MPIPPLCRLIICMNQKYLLIYLFFWMGALALSITSIPVFAQSEPEPPRLSAEIMELPPYSEAHPKVQISSTTATGDRASGYAYAADLLSIDWPPPGMEPILWAPSSGYRKQPVEQDTSLVLVVATAQLSSDGTATVGTLSRSPRDPLKARTLDRAYRWSESAGFQWLPAPDEAQTRAYACSDDGSYVIGRILRHSTNPAREVRWHADGTVDTVPPIAGNTRCFLRGVSGSGTVAVGTSFPPRSDTIFSRRAFYWTPTEGSRPVPGLEAYGTSEANAVSADGRYIVGYAYDGPLSNLPDARAWRYSKAEGLEWLGYLDRHRPERRRKCRRRIVP